MKPYVSRHFSAVFSATMAAVFGGAFLTVDLDTARAGDGAGCFWCPKSAPFSNTTNLNARNEEGKKPKSVQKKTKQQTVKARPAPQKSAPAVQTANRPAPQNAASALVPTSMSSVQVKAIQDCLLIIGLDPGPSDGISRGATHQAVGEFRRINGIQPAVAGLEDRQTLDLMFDLCQKPHPADMMTASAPVPPAAKLSRHTMSTVEVASAPSAGGSVSIPVTPGPGSSGPSSANVRLSLASMKTGLGYEQDGKYDMAIASYSKAIEQNPTLAFAYINRGSALASKGELQSAIADYTTAIKLSPNYARAYVSRGLVYARKGEFTSAIADYDKAIELDPLSSEFYNNRAAAYESVGAVDTGIKDYKTALEIDPASREAKDALERLGAATN